MGADEKVSDVAEAVFPPCIEAVHPPHPPPGPLTIHGVTITGGIGGIGGVGTASGLFTVIFTVALFHWTIPSLAL